MKLVIMTRSTFFVEEDKILTTLFEEGMESLHLYKPDSEPVYSNANLAKFDMAVPANYAGARVVGE